MAILKKNGKNIKNYFDYDKESAGTLKYKRGIIANLKFDTPMFSWPKDKVGLLSIINTYLANLKLGKIEDNKESFKSQDKDETVVITDDESLESKTTDENVVVDDETDEQSHDQTDDMVVVDESTETKDDSQKEESSSGYLELGDIDAPEIEYVDESEYIDIPEQIYDIANCTAKMLGNIVRILNYRSKALKKIRLLKNARQPLEVVNEEIEKVAVYNIVLAKYLPILNKQDVADSVNIKKATQIFEDVCSEGYEEVPTERNIESEIKKNKEQQDFDIISALSYCGVDIDKNEYGEYDVVRVGNGNGIKYFIGKNEKAFAMSRDACAKFLDRFLNQPIETRRFMTPGQVFITYINEAEKSLGINTRSATELSDLFGTMNSNRNAKAYFKDAIRRYSRNAQEWKDFQKIFEAEYYANKDRNDDDRARIHIKQQAKRLVIGEIMEYLLNEGEILKPEQIAINDYRIGDISRDFGLDIDLDEIKVNKTRIERVEDYSFRLINILHSSILDMKAFVQDIIDNYTVDYLRKEKIFILQQDDQNEFITKKKDYEDLIEKLSYDKAKDSTQQIAYYQSQVDELTQKIGSQEYRDAKEDLMKSKNNFRILLLNAKSQKELVKAELSKASDNAISQKRKLTIDEKLDIVKSVLSNAPELIVTFAKGKAISWTKPVNGAKAEKTEEKLSNVDKIIEFTASKISDESHQKILEENKIRESVKKAQKEERVKSVNAYINAIGTIVGSAAGVGGFNGFNMPYAPVQNQTVGGSNPSSSNFGRGTPPVSQNSASAPQTQIVQNPESVVNTNQENKTFGNSSVSTGQGSPNFGGQNGGYAQSVANYGSNTVSVPMANTGAGYSNNASNGYSQGVPVSPTIVQSPTIAPMTGYGYAQMPMGAMGGMPYMSNNQPNFNKDYQNFDFISEGVEPCVIPFIVGYESNGTTTYGNMLENYATFDRYKFLLTTNNNSLFSYLETKKAQIQNPEQIISDLHIRYIKNAMAKSGFATQDGKLTNFDYKGDVKKFLTKFVPLNIIDIVINDYNDMIETVDFDLLKDMIESKFRGELESFVPDKIKADMIKSANMIATVSKTIMSDNGIRKTYEEYSSKMKQTYVNSLIQKIEHNEIPMVKLDSDAVYNRMIDYISFSTKGQNVIIQSEDNKDSGFGTYPRATFFKQKENADNNLKIGKTLSYEQNEIITTRNDPKLEGLDSNVVNLFGTLYKFNGGYNKLLLKLKPNMLKSGVKFMENLVDALREKLDIKATVIVEEDKKPVVPLVKFASKEKNVDPSEMEYNYDDDKWYIRKGFVLDKERVKEYALLLALGMKYALDREKTKLNEDFYKDGLLSITKINEFFSGFSSEFVSLATTVIRTIKMSNCERYIDYIDMVNKNCSLHINKMLYINRMIMESNSFDKKTIDEKKETIDSLESGFERMSEDIKNPHPEIYSSLEEIEHYMTLYLYYAISEIFEKYADDEKIICNAFIDFYANKKKDFRNMLLAMIRDHIYMNGYEEEMAEYFELNMDKVVTLDDKPLEEESEEIVEEKKKDRIKIKNIDVIFKGIYDGFAKSIKNETSQILSDEIEKMNQILELVGTLPSIDSEEKDLEIALPNSQTIICNIKGFVQQYLFRYIVDKEHELGPFAYVVKELEEHEEFGAIVSNLEEVAEKLNCQELGINLIAKFSSITLSNNGNIFKIGDNISTVVETVNRLKTPTDMQKALNRDVFYKEGVAAVAKSFEQYFSRRKLENME